MADSQKPTMVCNKCGSPRMLYVRLDSDWAYGGTVSRINSDSFYESNDPTDYEDRPDIELHHCLACGHQEN